MSRIEILKRSSKRGVTMKKKILTTAISLALFGAVLVPKVRADELDKMTTVTFSEPVQVSGTVLPAGSYVFKLMDSESDSNVVQIFNADDTRLIMTTTAVSDYQTKTPDEPVFSFEERPSGQPEALKAWFYPGDNYGEQFLDSK
jgi:hypothetical protein